MPQIWRNGIRVEGTMPEFVEQLRQVADWADQKFSIMSDTRARLGEYLRSAADELEKIGCG